MSVMSRDSTTVAPASFVAINTRSPLTVFTTVFSPGGKESNGSDSSPAV